MISIIKNGELRVTRKGQVIATSIVISQQVLGQGNYAPKYIFFFLQEGLTEFIGPVTPSEHDPGFLS